MKSKTLSTIRDSRIKVAKPYTKRDLATNLYNFISYSKTEGTSIDWMLKTFEGYSIDDILQAIGELSMNGDIVSRTKGVYTIAKYAQTVKLSGDWVEDAIEYGWWNELEQLKSYEEDVAHDAREAHPSFKEEIEGDLARIRERILELTPPAKLKTSKPRTLPSEAQNVQTVGFDSQLFECYGKQPKQGFRAYCRRKP